MNKKLNLMFGMLLIVLTLFPLISAVQDPVLYTGEAKEINSKSAVLEGELIDLGSSVDLNMSFEYREEGITEWNETEPFNLDVETNFQKSIKNLDTGTYYQYRVKGEDNGDVYYGAVRTFETDVRDSIFKVDFNKDSNLKIFIIFLVLAGILFYLGFAEFSSLIVTISGFILMFSGINFIISTIVIILGIFIAFMKGGSD